MKSIALLIFAKALRYLIIKPLKAIAIALIEIGKILQK